MTLKGDSKCACTAICVGRSMVSCQGGNVAQQPLPCLLHGCFEKPQSVSLALPTVLQCSKLRVSGTYVRNVSKVHPCLLFLVLLCLLCWYRTF